MTLLESLSYMVDETDETMLSFYLDNAKSVILNKLYPFDNEFQKSEGILPMRYEGLLLRIAAYMVNKQGAEGETQHNENQVYRYYGSADVPDDMMSEIISTVGVIS